ncbi:AAA family ATPase [Marinobacter sp.]|uniref:AAA family ATPase n=1 Tax=Marinobacter sp. TaxID=50741 RepID=UPI0035646B9C
MAKNETAFTGIIESFLWKDNKSNHALIKLKNVTTIDSSLPQSVVCSGTFGDLKPGMKVLGKGSARENRQNQLEVRVKAFEVIFPNTAYDTLQFLLADGLPYISSVRTAMAFIKAGNDGKMPSGMCRAIRKLAKNPEDFRLPGYPASIIKEMSDAVNAEGQRITTINWLVRNMGVRREEAISLEKQIPGDPEEYIRQRPYKAGKLFNLEFSICDQVAKNLGVLESQRGDRIDAALYSAFKEKIDRGSTAIPFDELKDSLTNKIGAFHDAKSIIEALQLSDNYSHIQIGDHHVVQQKKWSVVEQKIAKELHRIATAKSVLAPNEWKMEKKPGESGYDQERAILMALNANVSILTGGPGTGKTTTVKRILKSVKEAGKNDGSAVRFSLSAPSGLAALRLSQQAELEAKTLHKTLQMTYTGAPKKDKENPIIADMVVIDEGSMLDAEIFLKALEAAPSGSKVLLVGDPDQLPSVGAGNVLEDLINSKNRLIPSTRLGEVFRNAGPIAENAHEINKGNSPDISAQHVVDEGEKWNVWLMKSDAEKKVALRQLIRNELIQNCGYKHSDIQVLSPQHKGELGTESLNVMLQEVINPMGPGKVSMKIGANGEYRTGDKIIYLTNSPEKNLVNGDTGYIQMIDERKREAVVRFNGVDVKLDRRTLSQRTKLAYCLSVHKSQGSEYPCVILPMSEKHKWTRQLYYTGVTRGKKHVYTLTDENTLEAAVKDSHREHRITGLQAAVNKYCPEGSDYELKVENGFEKLVPMEKPQSQEYSTLKAEPLSF